MDLIRWGNGLAEPFLEFESLQDEINRLFDGVRSPEPRGLFDRAFSPAVDVVEHGDRFEVLCDVPGVEAKDIETSISGAVLTIKGERKESGTSESANLYRTDRRAGKFQRTLQLPLPVNAGQVEAQLKDGVLRIVLPKQEELKPRQITVKAK
jgi:HSP20 family protein